MLTASLYIIGCSAKNVLRVRLRRLREPRYLLGAIAGFAYLYFSFFGRLRFRQSSQARRRRNQPATPETMALLSSVGPALAGLALMVSTAAAWILPVDSGLLEFSKAEVQFLFPAPVSRRWLLAHRMLRSQIGMLFGALIVGIVTPSISGYTRLRIGIAMWLLMCTSKVYFTGVTLARARLTSDSSRARRVAWLPLGVMVAALAIVGAALVTAFTARPVEGPRDALLRLGEVAGSGAPRIVMAPFIAVASPLFAAWPQPYLLSLLASVAVLAASVIWVLLSDETFQETAAEIAERKRTEAATPSAAAYRVRGPALRLATHGAPEGVFAWKAAVQTLRIVDLRVMLRLAVVTVAMMAAAFTSGRPSGVAAMFGTFAMGGALFTVLMGPQVMRMDVRQDLQHLELLKTWPVAAAAVVRGELLWPGVLLTGMSWAMAGVALLMSGATFARVSLDTRIAVAAAFILLAPALVFAQLAIHNGVALMFPAWVPLGAQRPRGLDAMGQRLIILGGTWLGLVVMALPGAMVAGIVWFALRGLIGAAAIAIGASVAAVILGVEVLVATEALGPFYERLDLLAVERAE